MKHQKISFVCVFLVLLMLLSACTVGNQPEADPEAPTEEETQAPEPAETNELRIIENGKTEYTLVYSGVSQEVFAKIQELVANVKSKTGVELPQKKIGGNESLPEGFRAILIGKTACGGVPNDLRRNDYLLCASGQNILINAHEDAELLNALTYFYQQVLESNYENNVFVLEKGFEYLCAAQYTINSMTLLQAGIAEYRVVIPKSYTPAEFYAARLIWDHLTSKTGIYMDFVTDDQPATGHEILIGSTNRHSAVVGEYEYAIGAEGGSVWMQASELYSYGAMADYVTGTLFSTKEKTLVVDQIAETRNNVRSSLSVMQQQKYGDTRVLFNNVLGNCDQTLYPVARRNEMLADIYRVYDPDVIAMQECSGNSRSGSSSIIELLRQQGYEEVPVTGCSTNLFTPVLYHTERLELIESGYLLYTLNALKDNSKSMVWAVLEKKETHERFAVISTHFTTYGSAEFPNATARVGNATELLKRIGLIYEAYQCPVIIGGDLNCNVNSEALKLLAQTGTHARTAAPITSTTKTGHSDQKPVYLPELGIYTTNASPQTDNSNSVDHIFFFHDQNVEIKAFEVCSDKYSFRSTDHCPVIVDFSFKSL